MVTPQLINALKTNWRSSVVGLPGNLRIYSLAENLAEKIGDKRLTAEMLNSVAAMQRMLADYPGAIDTVRKSLAISEGIGISWPWQTHCWGSEQNSSSQGSYTAALEYYEKFGNQ